MSLTMVQATNSRGQTLSLPIFSTSSDGFKTHDVEGLDPIKAQVSSTEYGLLDGEFFQATRRGRRNIVLKLGYEPDWGVTDIRTMRGQLYDFFSPESVVTLSFFLNGTLHSTIEGVVEDFKSPLFTEEPEAHISILCFKPDFVAPTITSRSLSTTTGTGEAQINYAGSADVGIEVEIAVNITIASFTLNMRHESGKSYQVHMQRAGNWFAGDVLLLSTVPGRKGFWLTSATPDISQLTAIQPDQAMDLVLSKGLNYVRITAPNSGVPYVVRYHTKYVGV